MNNTIQNVVALIILVFAFGGFSHFCYVHKVHPCVATVVLLLILSVIISEVCWIVLSCIHNNVDVVMCIINILDAMDITGEFLLDILVISVLYFSRRWRNTTKT